jgi:transposase-like protein
MGNTEQHIIEHKIKILNHAKETKNVSKTCRYFGISRESFYTWKRAFEAYGESGLKNKKPGMVSRNIHSPRRVEPGSYLPF